MKDENIKNYMIDYLSITVHLPLLDCVDLYNQHFRYALFDLNDLPHGAKGFRGVKEAAMGFQLKHSPGHDRNYCSFNFPGKACKAVPPEYFIYFYRTLVREEIKFNVSRLDFAYDGVPFTPCDFSRVFEDDKKRSENGQKQKVRTLTQRETVQLITEPYKEKEDGSGFSRDTFYLGSRSSERFLRVYNKRGPTRLEVEYKGKRAALVANEILMEDEDQWLDISLSHLLAFIDIDISWWKDFKGDRERSYVKLHCAKEKSLEKINDWLMNQVSPTFAAVIECTGGQIISDMIDSGKKRMRKNHKNLLSQYGK